MIKKGSKVKVISIGKKDALYPYRDQLLGKQGEVAEFRYGGLEYNSKHSAYFGDIRFKHSIKTEYEEFRLVRFHQVRVKLVK